MIIIYYKLNTTLQTHKISMRKVAIFVLLLFFAAMAVYGLFFRQIEVYTEDGTSVAGKLKGADLIPKVVLKAIAKNEEANAFYETGSTATECPT
ncbi:hypothetical protein ACFLS1_08720 [Verrucomicrobiota bacterium]